MPKTVAQWCHERQLTVEQLAERSSLDQERVNAIVLGRWTPSPEERQQIAAALETVVDEVVWGHVTPVQHLYGHGPA